MRDGGINGIALAALLAGSVFVYSGIRGYSVLKSVQNIVQGSNPVTAQQEATLTQDANAAVSGSAPPPSNAEVAHNQAIAKMLAAPYGWSGGSNWTSLVNLWNKESGWNKGARNATSDATGIPQLNPADHTIPPGWSSAAVQIAWGLNYIHGTYGSPDAAWAHEQAVGWY